MDKRISEILITKPEKYQLVWLYLWARSYNGVTDFNYAEIMLKFQIPKATIFRILKLQDEWNSLTKTDLTSIIKNPDFSVHLSFMDGDPTKAKPEKPVAPIKEVLEYLNLVAGKSYRASTASNKKVINARFNEGYKLSDFKRVIDNKWLDWGNDRSNERYLRPETLFGNKFEGYLNEKKDIPEQGRVTKLINNQMTIDDILESGGLDQQIESLGT